MQNSCIQLVLTTIPCISCIHEDAKMLRFPSSPLNHPHKFVYNDWQLRNISTTNDVTTGDNKCSRIGLLVICFMKLRPFTSFTFGIIAESDDVMDPNRECTTRRRALIINIGVNINTDKQANNKTKICSLGNQLPQEHQAAEMGQSVDVRFEERACIDRFSLFSIFVCVQKYVM